MVLRRIASFGRRSKRSPRNNATPAQNVNWLEIARSGAGETVNVNCRRSALGEFGVHLDLVQGLAPMGAPVLETSSDAGAHRSFPHKSIIPQTSS